MKTTAEENKFNVKFILNWIKYSFFGIFLSIVSYKLLVDIFGLTFFGHAEVFSAVWVAVLGVAMSRNNASSLGK